MQSKAPTVASYLKEIPAERREHINEIRDLILKNLPDGYQESMNWGMICYEIPLDYNPDTYNKKPLMYAALASQKNHMAIYLSGIYIDDKLRTQFEEGFKESGKKMNMGKSCVRFKKTDDLPLPVIAHAISGMTVDEFIQAMESNRKKHLKKKG